MKELEKEFNKCWSEMLTKCYTCKCKDKEGFAIRLKDLHIFGKDFKKDLFSTFKTLLTQSSNEEIIITNKREDKSSPKKS